ncbi:MAG: shikimate dehydrogenase [Cellulomonadaceae bacterium]|jgi:shikimate dehydrogenase|nr:shikimate dehydrogenase [Cellulomonadaceae bacterium]
MDSPFKAAVLGHPIAHSLSPVVHHAAYRALNLPGEYTAVDLTPDTLPTFMGEFRTDPSWRGLSVTMPLKVHLDSFITQWDASVDAVGARIVNTVVKDSAGRLTAYNTDSWGISQALREASPDLALHGSSSVVIVGGGATATTAVSAMAALASPALDAAPPASSPPTAQSRVSPPIVVLTADPTVREPVDAAAEVLGIPLRRAPISQAVEYLPQASVVISTIPEHAAATLAPALSQAPLQPGAVLLDCIYDPWPTTLSRAWQEAGGIAVGGDRMLLHQAVEQVRLMTGCQDVPVTDMDKALKKALDERKRVG